MVKFSAIIITQIDHLLLLLLLFAISVGFLSLRSAQYVCSHAFTRALVFFCVHVPVRYFVLHPSNTPPKIPTPLSSPATKTITTGVAGNQYMQQTNQ
jgi:hypothetical protein